MSLQFEITRIMSVYKWSQAFTIEYVMARQIHGVGHEKAIQMAKNSPYIKFTDIPKGI